MGKKTTVQKNDPWAPAQPYILKNLKQQDAVFTASQPALMQAAADQRALTIVGATSRTGFWSRAAGSWR